MATTSVEAQGVELRMGNGDGPPETFTKIGQPVSIEGPSGTAAVIDVTTLDSTAREKRMGLPDEGQITFELIYDPAEVKQEALRAARAARSLHNFQLVLTDTSATQFDFSAYVLEFSLSAAVDEVVRASVTLEITGAVAKA